MFDHWDTPRLGLDTANVNGRVVDAHDAFTRGLRLSLHKVSQGTSFIDSLWVPNHAAARKAGFRWVGGYHFLEAGRGAAQAAAYARALAKANDFRVFHIVDVELQNSHVGPSYADVLDYCTEHERIFGYRMVDGRKVAGILYTGAWYWKGHLGNPRAPEGWLLWDSDYVGGRGGPFAIFGQLKPGQDAGVGVTPDLFAAYGGWTVQTRFARQFTSSASAGGLSPVDCSATWASAAELDELAGIVVTPVKQPTKPTVHPPVVARTHLGPFPLPRGHYFGMRSSNPACHSGYWQGDRAPIERLQHRLGELGYHVGRAGEYDHITQAAVEQLQRHKHLKVDGKTGVLTWKAADA